MECVPEQAFAEGYTAEIYVYQERKVLKLFREWVPPEWVDYEACVARAVHDLDLPVPAVGEIVEHQGRRGIIYERAEGISLLKTFQVKPWKIAWIARLLAELHADIHTQIVNDSFPSQWQRLIDGIQQAAMLPADLRNVVLAMLDRLPFNDRLCHNDFHPDNIIITKHGPIVIDWMNVARGNPLADVARTSLMIRFGQPISGGKVAFWLMNQGRTVLHNTYLQHYFKLTGRNQEQFAQWETVVAAARLHENIPGEHEHLLAIIKRGCRAERDGGHL